MPQTANDWVRANVKELMQHRKMTQAQLALRLGVSQPWLSKRLTGTTEFQMGDLDAIARVFLLSPSELLCAGYGKWERRVGNDRRTGADRRQGRPRIPFPHRESPSLTNSNPDEVH